MSIIVYKSERTMSNYASQWHLSSQHPCKIPMPRSNRHKTAAEDAEEFPMLEHWKAYTETKGGGGGGGEKSPENGRKMKPGKNKSDPLDWTQRTEI